MLTKQQLAVLRSEPGSNRVAEAMALTGVTQVTVAKALGLTQPYQPVVEPLSACRRRCPPQVAPHARGVNRR